MEEKTHFTDNIDTWIEEHCEKITKIADGGFPVLITHLILKQSPPTESPRWVDCVSFAAPIFKGNEEEAYNQIYKTEQRIVDGDLTGGGLIHERHILRVQEKNNA
jgi:hypothetical protein